MWKMGKFAPRDYANRMNLFFGGNGKGAFCKKLPSHPPSPQAQPAKTFSMGDIIFLGGIVSCDCPVLFQNKFFTGMVKKTDAQVNVVFRQDIRIQPYGNMP